MRLVAGLDEAGRGPVIGPMVIAGVVIDDSRIPQLLDIGVKDSKKLTPKKREELLGSIMELIERHRVEIIPPEAIDGIRVAKNINLLEVEVFTGIINRLSPDVAQIGSVDVDCTRFKKRICAGINQSVEVISVHHAEDAYPAVAAASIVAKTARDGEIASLWEQYGDFGSGYPSDPKTRAYIINKIELGEALPPIVRHSWKTITELANCIKNGSLKTF